MYGKKLKRKSCQKKVEKFDVRKATEVLAVLLRESERERKKEREREREKERKRERERKKERKREGKKDS
jgi:hypothetical protein